MLLEKYRYVYKDFDWEQLMHKHAQPAGRAVGFFNSRSSAKAVKYYLPIIEEMTEKPKEVKIKRTSAAKMKRNRLLRKAASDAHGQGAMHALKGSCQAADGEAVAIEIKTILKQAYQSPLYKEDDEFRGSVHYRERRCYITYVQYPVPKSWYF